MSEHSSAVRRIATIAILCTSFIVMAPAANALTDEECASLVAEGSQARTDLQKLIDRVSADPSAGDTSDPDTASYVAELIASAGINEFGFVEASAGAPLDICLPEGTTQVTLASDPVVVWTGPPASADQPVTIQIPASIECGSHTLRATGAGVDKSTSFEVGGSCTKVAGSTVSSFLPRTGAEVGRLVGVGVALIAIGFSISRRRRTVVSDDVTI